MALTTKDTKAFPTRAILLGFARDACHLSLRRAQGLLGQVFDAVAKTRREIRRFARAHPDFAKAATVLTSVFDQQVALLQGTK
ncbi:MAG: hypothetical protein EXR39_14800 [Betaproteobacteria bacterium]|nr:hypothetical protein [Betaproteobacteria bacterium]